MDKQVPEAGTGAIETTGPGQQQAVRVASVLNRVGSQRICGQWELESEEESEPHTVQILAVLGLIRSKPKPLSPNVVFVTTPVPGGPWAGQERGSHSLVLC